MASNSSILSVLSGNDSIKIDVAIDLKTIAILGATIFVAVLAAVFITKNN